MAGRRGQGASRRAPGSVLSRQQVLDAGLELLESGGIEAVTIRGLAAKLGVAPTAIYWHVGNKQDLLDGLAERIIVRLGDVTVRGVDPATRIVSIARALRETLLRQPELVALVHRQGRTAELFQPARRVLLHELVASGITGAEAVLAVHAVLNLVVGSVLLDRQLERQPTQRRTPEELWRPSDIAGHPELLGHLAHPVDEEELFDFTVGVVVAAVLGS